MNKLSVIVPIFNTEEFLTQCVESLISQKYDNLEIILVNDGSTDQSITICNDFKKKDARVIVVDKENGGEASARIAGVNVATGNYITFCDSDDWIEESYQEMMEIVENLNVDVFISKFMYVNRKDKPIEYMQSNVDTGLYENEGIANIKDSLFEIMPSLCNKIFKKELIIDYVNQVDRGTVIGADMAVSYPAILSAKKIYVHEKPFYHYLIGYRESYGYEQPVKFISHCKVYGILKKGFEVYPSQKIKNDLDKEFLRRLIRVIQVICMEKKLDILKRYKQLNQLRNEHDTTDAIEGINGNDAIFNSVDEDINIWKLFYTKKNWILIIYMYLCKFQKKITKR